MKIQIFGETIYVANLIIGKLNVDSLSNDKSYILTPKVLEKNKLFNYNTILSNCS